MEELNNEALDEALEALDRANEEAMKDDEWIEKEWEKADYWGD